MQMPSLVVLTTIHAPTLTAFECISISQCEKKLPDYPKYFICPRSLDTTFYEEHFKTYKICKIDDHWQKNYYMFNRLKVENILYDTFKDYDFILFYEPDAFIFGDIRPWLQKNTDYWGAPWLVGFNEATENAPFLGVGNGGFSLRRTKSCLAMSAHFDQLLQPKHLVNVLFDKKISFHLLFKLFFLKHPITLRWFGRTLNHYCNEDEFFGMFAVKKCPNFKVASVEEAIPFAFEMQPRRLYLVNNNALPLGCHAWWKHDLAFWKPFIEAEGYILP